MSKLLDAAELTLKVRESYNAAKGIATAERFEANIREWATLIRAIVKRDGCTEIEAVIYLGNKTPDDHRGGVHLMWMFAAQWALQEHPGLREEADTLAIERLAEAAKEEPLHNGN